MWSLLFAQHEKQRAVVPVSMPSNVFTWVYKEAVDAVSKSSAVVALYRTYLEWVPFSGGRGIDTTGQIIVAAVSGAAVAAVLCIKWLQMHKGDYRHLKDKLRHLAVFISGCDSGLGYSLAVHCHDKLGLTVFAGCLKPDGEGAFRLRQRASNRMHIIPLDVTKPDSVTLAKKTVQNILHSKSLELTALVNNAGVMVFGEFDWITERLMKYQVDVNLLGTMRLTRAFISLLREHHGRIITVSSHCALETLPGLAVYGATKTALRAWSDGLRLELAKFNMNVITIIPGSFSTQSNILACQGLHAKEMHLAMSADDKELYGEYFDRYNSYLSSLFVDRGPIVLSDKLLYRKFNHALLSTCPRVNYIVSPLRYTIYHTLFKLSPIRVRDWLVNNFVSMPEWKTTKVRADSKPEILLAQPEEHVKSEDDDEEEEENQ